MFNGVYFKAMESSLDALDMKQKIHMNNIANISTPGFKPQDLKFEDVLTGARDGLDAKLHNFRAVITTDNNSVLPDGNNVSIDNEEMELYKVYVQTLALYQKVGGDLKNTRYVINNILK